MTGSPPPSEPSRDWRWPVLLLVLSYYAAWFVLAGEHGAPQAWRLLGVPAWGAPFLDLQVVLGGLESARQGLDPLVTNPGDPLGRPMNYPRLWLGLAPTGLEVAHTVPLGILLGLGFFACAFAHMDPRSGKEALLLAAFYLSPAVGLLVERGNVDSVMFVLLTGALLSARRWRLALPWVLLAGALKLYPTAALGLFLRERRGVALAIAGGSLAAFAVYLLATWGDLALLIQSTERDHRLSFGNLVLFQGLAAQSGGGAPGKPALLAALAWGTTALVAAAAVWAGWRARLDGLPGLDRLRVGGGVYLGSFLLGNNWAYRLVFLGLTLTALFALARAPGRRGRFGRATLAAVLLAVGGGLLEGSLGQQPAFWIGQLATWGVFAALCGLLTATRPAWVWR